jgi:hypothetical protein|tara:strand:+ start:200 stop:352 length:153 start_codon:yes stop_codon:yes gene_type:complete
LKQSAIAFEIGGRYLLGDQGTGARLKLRSVFAGDNPLPLAVIDGDPNRCD